MNRTADVWQRFEKFDWKCGFNWNHISHSLDSPVFAHMNIQAQNSHGASDGVWNVQRTSTVKCMHRKHHWNGFYCKCRFSYFFLFALLKCVRFMLMRVGRRACTSTSTNISMCVSQSKGKENVNDLKLSTPENSLKRHPTRNNFRKSNIRSVFSFLFATHWMTWLHNRFLFSFIFCSASKAYDYRSVINPERVCYWVFMAEMQNKNRSNGITKIGDSIWINMPLIDY